MHAIKALFKILVMMDRERQEVVFETKSLEAMGYEIDRMKVQKRFTV
jgi:hypothetical protein